MSKYPFLSIVIMLVWGAMSDSQASIALSQTILQFDYAQGKRQDIEVINHGDEPVYLAIEAFEVTAPGRTSEKREKIVNPKKAGLLVTPKKAAISAGGRQVVRFVNLLGVSNAPERDRIYRVTVTPVVGELSATQSALKVIIAYEVLVIIRPQSARAELVAVRDGRWLEFKNSGNTNALLRKGNICEGDERDCVDLPGKRLYAGNTWRVALPSDGPVIYEYSVGHEIFEKTVK